MHEMNADGVGKTAPSAQGGVVSPRSLSNSSALIARACSRLEITLLNFFDHMLSFMAHAQTCDKASLYALICSCFVSCTACLLAETSVEQQWQWQQQCTCVELRLHFPSSWVTTKS